jgi:NAD(P)H-hydrate epimerase
MRPNPLALWKSAQVRAIDAFAIGTLQTPGYELMRRAAAAALAELQRRWPAARRLLVLCGSGNNAGDGYVLARLAVAAGLSARIGAVSEPAALRGDAARAFADWHSSGGATLPWRDALAEGPDVVVDALLGIGASRDLDGEFAAAVALLNDSRRPVLALDIPSGLQADSGAVLGVCVRADCTVTFIAHKAGLWLANGPDQCGDLVLADLELERWPDDLGDPVVSASDPLEVSAALPARTRGANKGRFGHVLIVGGGPGMSGAARLCGEAAMRVGAGLVSVATAPEHAAQLATVMPELMVSAVGSAADLMPLLKRADVVAIGPGLGQSAWARGIWSCAMAGGLPLIVDADALNLLAAHPEKRDDWVLTPHPGEAGRLLEIPTAAVQADRLAAVSALRDRYGGTVVLKGAGSLVAGPTGVCICLHGNPGMAAAGMGDVLTGVIAGIHGQVRELALAARIGVLVHALAGDQAALHGQRGMIASDVIAELRGCVNPIAR